MAYTTIDDPSAYFHTQLYTGDGSSNNAITNDANAGDFQPDWLWIKSRSYSDLHAVFDSSRGRDKRIFPNSANAEGDSSPDNFLKSFDTDGFTIGNDAGLNTSSGTLVAWQWKANGGTTASNTDGTITSTVQANTTAGFSIVTYDGTGSSGATFGHGLGTVPNFIIIKNRSEVKDWTVYHGANTSAPETDALFLNLTDATIDNTGYWNDTAPTSSIITLGDNTKVNSSGEQHVAYCFTEKQGYSKFGSYVGNGSEPDGPFIYTGFKPAWFMVHASSEAGQAWFIGDSKRDPDNVAVAKLAANTSSVESAVVGDNNWDFLSNGFKIRTQDDGMNKSGITFLYMAFAEHPFVSSEGVPTTAR
jgi:hypothetical protein